MRELFAQRQRLNAVLDQARVLRRSVRPWNTERTVARIEHLLHGKSVGLERIKTPLAQRGLLEAAEQAAMVEPETLVSAMSTAFEQARDAVLAVEHARANLLPMLDDARKCLNDLRRTATTVGESVEPALTSIEASLDRLQASIERDPLGTQQRAIAELLPQIEALHARLAASVEARARVQSDLARAGRLLDELRSVHDAARQECLRCAEEIVNPVGSDSAAAEGKLGQLTAWLNTLGATVADGRWSAAQVGLGRWFQAANELLDYERAAAAAMRAQLAARDELTGRLQARRAQARALAARGRSLDAALDEVALEAGSVLRTRPTDVARAAELVRRYESAITDLGRKQK